MDEKKKCRLDECGHVFVPSHVNQCYCNAICRNKASVKRMKKVKSEGKEVFNRTCASETCFNTFITTKSRKIYCSARCAVIENRRLKLKDILAIVIDRTCANPRCKKLFQDHRRNVKYCPDCSLRIRDSSIFRQIKVLQKHECRLNMLKIHDFQKNHYREIFEYAYAKLDANFPPENKENCYVSYLMLNKSGFNPLDVAFQIIYEYSRINCKTIVSFQLVKMHLSPNCKVKGIKRRIRESLPSRLKPDSICTISDLVTKYIVQFFTIRKDLTRMKNVTLQLAANVEKKMQGRAPHLRAMVCIYFILEKMRDERFVTQRALISQEEFCYIFKNMGLTINDLTIRNYMKDFGTILEEEFKIITII